MIHGLTAIPFFAFLVLSIYYIRRSDFLEECRNTIPLEVNTIYTVALVLARGGSKGILLKNLAEVGNQTLLGRALSTLNKFGHFDAIWVSTDHPLLADEAQRYNAHVHWRDPLSATDNASSLAGIIDFLKEHKEPNVICLVQCTSPFLNEKYLEKAFDLLLEGYDSVFSVTRQHKLRWKFVKGRYESANFNFLSRPRRQDWEGELVENGMFYLFKTELLRKCGAFQGGKIGVVEVPKIDSIEVDEPSDLHIANTLIELY